MAEYSTAFKLHTVKKSHQPGVTVAGLAADVGVHPATLYRWRAAVQENPAEPFLDPAERQAREEARLAAERAAQEASLDQLITEARADGRLPHRLEHLGIIDNKYQPDLAHARHDGQTLMDQRAYYARIWRFIDQHSAAYPVQLLCRRLAVSRSGYYRWVQRQPGEDGRSPKRERPPETYPPGTIDLLYSQAQLYWARQGSSCAEMVHILKWLATRRHLSSGILSWRPDLLAGINWPFAAETAELNGLWQAFQAGQQSGSTPVILSESALPEPTAPGPLTPPPWPAGSVPGEQRPFSPTADPPRQVHRPPADSVAILSPLTLVSSGGTRDLGWQNGQRAVRTAVDPARLRPSPGPRSHSLSSRLTQPRR